MRDIKKFKEQWRELQTRWDIQEILIYTPKKQAYRFLPLSSVQLPERSAA